MSRIEIVVRSVAFSPHFKEIIVKTGNTSLELGFLDEDELKELALHLESVIHALSPLKNSQSGG